MAEIRASDLDRELQFRRAALADDGFSKVETFTDLGDPVRGRRVAVSDGEVWRAAQVSARITARFTVRYTEFTLQISAQDRLTCDGTEYAITGIKEVGARRRWLEISATAQI